MMCLWCTQVFLGDGWSAIMDGAERETYETYGWFFLAYRLLVGVLFSNLLMGVLLGEFAACEKQRKTLVGEVRLIFQDVAMVLLPAQQEQLQAKLGVVAQTLLHAKEQDANNDLVNFGVVNIEFSQLSALTSDEQQSHSVQNTAPPPPLKPEEQQADNGFQNQMLSSAPSRSPNPEEQL